MTPVQIKPSINLMHLCGERRPQELSPTASHCRIWECVCVWGDIPLELSLTLHRLGLLLQFWRWGQSAPQLSGHLQ